MNEDTQDSREGLSRILSKAERMLQAAEAAMDDGFVESAASRAYYSAFHAIQALMRSIDKTYSKHSGVIAAFHRDFIKTGVFPPEFGMALTRLSKHRDIGDYSYIWTLKPEQVKDDIQKAGKIPYSNGFCGARCYYTQNAAGKHKMMPNLYDFCKISSFWQYYSALVSIPISRLNLTIKLV